MPSVKYAFITAYLKGQEARLVTVQHLEGMQAARGMQDALATIRETDVGSYLEELSVKSFDYLDESLWKYLAERLSFIEWLKLVPQDVRRVLKAYVRKYDVFNIKAALESTSSARKARMIPVGEIHDHGLLDELAGAGEPDDIIRVLHKCRLEGFVPALEQYEAGQGTQARRLVEARLEGEYYRNLLDTAKNAKDARLLVQSFGMIIDLTNLQIVCRAIIEGVEHGIAELIIAGGHEISDKSARELLSLDMAEVPSRLENTRYSDVAKEIVASYDRTKSVTAVDEVISRHKLRMLREVLAPRVLSPLVLAWYLILKEIETRNLRLVLKAIFDGLPAQETRDYLTL